MKHIIAFVSALFLAMPAFADAPASLGVLAPHIELAPQGSPWKVAEDQNALLLENRSEPGAVTYYYVEPQQRPITASVRTTVTADSAGRGPAGAGLIYALQGQGQNRLYYVFLVAPDGTTSLLRRDSGGIQQMIATRHPDLDTSRPVELKVEESGAGASFYVNGEAAGSVQSKGIGSGGVGIAALGTGRFTFRDFQLGSVSPR